jgi:hypothetical protein
MMPLMARPQRPGSSLSTLGTLTGAAAGIAVAVLAAGPLWLHRRSGEEQTLRLQWHLVPAIVARTDLVPGQRVSAAHDLSTRDLPLAIVTTGAVRGDGADRIEGQTIAVPVKAGDLLLWSYFDVPDGTLDQRDIERACRDARDAKWTGAPEKTAAEIRARLAQKGSP